MAKRLRAALTLAGVVGAVTWIGVAGKRTAPIEQIDAALTELDMVVRETSAGTQARAVTLAQLPRLAWAVVTDEATVRDLTTEELAFRPQEGEQIEIAQIEGKGGRVRRLIGIPAHAPSALAVSQPGLRLMVVGDDVLVTAIVRIEPVQRGTIVAGLLAVGQKLDTSRLATVLDSKGIGARLQTASGSAVIGGVQPPGSARTVERTLRSPAAEGAKLILSVPVGIAWGHVAGAVVLLCASILTGRLAGRGRQPVEPPKPALQVVQADVDEAPLFEGDDPTAVESPGNLADAGDGYVTRPVPTLDSIGGTEGRFTPARGVAGEGGGDLSASGTVGHQPGAQPGKEKPMELSGVVFAQGNSTTMPSSLFAGATGEPDATDAPPVEEPFATEYRALFKEFVKLRRTCGETTEGLDRNRFVGVLYQKRTALIAQHAATEVKFRLAFDNGRAAVRFKTIT